MEKIDREEIFGLLTAEELSDIKAYEERLISNLDVGDFSKAEYNELYSTIMDFQACFFAAEHYRNKYNDLAKVVNDMIRNPYEGTNKRERIAFANRYSKEVEKLKNLQLNYEEYRAMVEERTSEAVECDDRLATRVAEKGYGEEPAKAPKKGPTFENRTTSKKR